jgi:DNA-binding transcriptional MocR family regulator
MSPAHVLEPTYRRLKHAITNGTWQGGAKLEAQRLADEYGVSMTPVRDSLNQLAGEGLVELTPGQGFRVSPVTEQVLRDMFEVNAVLLEHANPPRSRLPAAAPGVEHGAEYADRVETVFSALAAVSDNRFLRSVVGHVSARVRVVRRIEPVVLADATDLIEGLEASMAGPASIRRSMVARYHQQCRACIPQLISRLEAR